MLEREGEGVQVLEVEVSRSRVSKSSERKLESWFEEGRIRLDCYGSDEEGGN